MAPHTEKHGFPSKVYTLMACAKPILVCSGTKTPIVNFLSGKKCAFLVEKKIIKEKVDAMVHIIRSISKEELIEMGNSGLNDINENYSKEIVTNRYLNLVETIIHHS
jgi:glycosyltransferase involved in cell wall biosynthesis